MLYFAYGSNLDCRQMRDRCRSSRFISIARLEGHRLAFSRKSINRKCGVADVVEASRESVWGVVYEIADGDVARLDIDEGFRAGRATNSYERVFKEVVLVDFGGGRAVRVETYVAKPQPQPPLPNRAYMEQVISGARFWNLPAQYIERLERVEVAQ